MSGIRPDDSFPWNSTPCWISISSQSRPRTRSPCCWSWSRPAATHGTQRPPSTLQVVLDRSGSMADGRLDAAKEALDALIARLDPTTASAW